MIARYQHFRLQRVTVMLVRVVATILIVSLTTLLLYAIRANLSASTIALLYLLPVGLAATLWGLLPGVGAALCAFLALNFFFTMPQLTLGVTHGEDLLALLVFLVVAVAISQLVGRTQASLRDAREREHDIVRLYELMTTLASLRNQDAIARTSAARLLEVFQAELVEIVSQPDARSATRISRAPSNAGTPSVAPTQVIALETPRGLIGEVRLWHTMLLTPIDERLLNAFTGQIALAMERATLAQVETRARVLEESDRLKSALLSSVSHELRTPLSTIKASITSMLSGNVDWDSAARIDLLTAVDEETDHLNRLVGNLLDMSRIESGALNPQRQWNLLSDIVAGVTTRMRHALERHHLLVDVPDDLPMTPVDHMQIDQVLTNLISNSLKYAPLSTTISLRARVLADTHLLVEVTNEGPRIAAEDLDRIFDKFYRVTAADRVTGTGLGLSICKGIVEAHGGKIWAENKQNGMAFYFTLPLTLDGQRAPQVLDEL